MRVARRAAGAAGDRRQRRTTGGGGRRRSLGGQLGPEGPVPDGGHQRHRQPGQAGAQHRQQQRRLGGAVGAEDPLLVHKRGRRGADVELRLGAGWLRERDARLRRGVADPARCRHLPGGRLRRRGRQPEQRRATAKSSCARTRTTGATTPNRTTTRTTSPRLALADWNKATLFRNGVRVWGRSRNDFHHPGHLKRPLLARGERAFCFACGRLLPYEFRCVAARKIVLRALALPFVLAIVMTALTTSENILS